ncbi:MAG: hypothetical protein WA047_06670 [Phenylobacterium sp.]|uniref:hypothetical protein n=1 Tax=Phenylobacterium sp. TaxID=1871053 RepID=UPI003BB56D93
MAGILSASAGKAALRMLAPFAGALAIAAAGFTAAEVYEHRAPLGLSHKLAMARTDTASWRKATGDVSRLAVAWATSYGKSEGFRAREQADAVADVNDAAKACDARVARARTSVAAIQALVTKEPPHDPNGCPVRRLLDARQLRDATAPPG